MKVNSNRLVKILALSTGIFFLGLSAFSISTTPVGPEDPISFDFRCVKLDPDTGVQKTVYENNKVLDFTTSVRDENVVFTLFFSEDRSAYELINVEKNMLCSVKQN